MVEIEFDPAKNRKNIQQRGLPFALAAEFDWTTALIAASDRRGESRFFAIGYIGNRLHALVFKTNRTAIRVISLRRANKKEVKRYEKARS
jgi:hypothetical protein